MTNEQRFWVILIIAYIIGVLSATKCSGQTTSLVRVQHDSFVSYYDTEKHCPAIMVYMLDRSHFAGNERLSGRHFKADTKLPRPRVHDGDYRNSGYVRGHLCAAADRDSKRTWLKETYLTSNLVPMTYTCNSGAWKVIEDSLRTLASHGHRLKVVKFPVWRYPQGAADCNTSGDLRSLIQEKVSKGTFYPENVPLDTCLNHGTEKSLRVIHYQSGTILVPDYFFCLAECQDCKFRFSLGCENVLGRCRLIENLGEVLPFVENYVQLILHNIIGLWSLEESETTTP
mgnify:FL=1